MTPFLGIVFSVSATVRLPPGVVGTMAFCGELRMPEVAMDPKLSDDLLHRLALHPGLEQLPATMRLARTGDHRALQELVVLSIPLSYRTTSEAWPGPESMQDIIDALGKEITALKPKSEVPARFARPTSKPRPSLQPIGDILSRIAIPQEKVASATPKDRAVDLAIGTGDLGRDGSQPKWSNLARDAGFPLDNLSCAEKEILSLVERVLIRGMGWGPGDRAKGMYRHIQLIPSRLSMHGRQHSCRTYQRAISRLMDLGLLRQTSRRLGGVREFTAAWWKGVETTDPIQIWRAAATIQQESDHQMSDLCRTNGGAMSEPCRTSVAPPVRPQTSLINSPDNDLRGDQVRQSAGRLTSDVLHEDVLRSLSRDRAAPLPAKGQARHGRFLQEGEGNAPGGNDADPNH